MTTSASGIVFHSFFRLRRRDFFFFRASLSLSLFFDSSALFVGSLFASRFFRILWNLEEQKWCVSFLFWVTKRTEKDDFFFNAIKKTIDCAHLIFFLLAFSLSFTPSQDPRSPALGGAASLVMTQNQPQDEQSRWLADALAAVKRSAFFMNKAMVRFAVFFHRVSMGFFFFFVAFVLLFFFFAKTSATRYILMS